MISIDNTYRLLSTNLALNRVTEKENQFTVKEKDSSVGLIMTPVNTHVCYCRLEPSIPGIF